jgi:hypothetical protein
MMDGRLWVPSGEKPRGRRLMSHSISADWLLIRPTVYERVDPFDPRVSRFQLTICDDSSHCPEHAAGDGIRFA